MSRSNKFDGERYMLIYNGITAETLRKANTLSYMFQDEDFKLDKRSS